MKPHSHFRPVSILASLALALPAFAGNEPPDAAPNAPEPPAQPEPAIRIEVGEAQMIPADGVEEQDAKPVDEAAVEEKTYLGLGSKAAPDFLGMHLNLPADTGVLVHYLDKDGPAAKAGIAKHDVITKVDDKAVATHQDLIDQIQAKKPGDEVSIDFIHQGKPGKVKVTLGAYKPGMDEDADEMPEIPGLENLPPEEQKRVRGKLKRMFKGQGAGGLQMIPGAGRIEIGPGGVMPLPHGGGDMQLRVGGMGVQMKMKDQNGSIEMKERDGGKEMEVRDKEGKEVWSGPWDTEQDKAAAPPEIRERIERLNGGTLLNGGGLRIMPLPAPVPMPEQDKKQDEKLDKAPAPKDAEE